jgi:hypothetical protein
MFILLIDVDDDTRSIVFNDLSLHDSFISTARGPGLDMWSDLPMPKYSFLKTN